MNDLPSTPDILPANPSPGMVYHCVCGTEFSIDIQQGGECPFCHRIIRAEAIRQALSATVTIDDVNQSTAFQLSEEVEEYPLVGAVLGHFRLDRGLGRGGMGTVYRALDMSLQRYVAVKIVRNVDDAGNASEDHVAIMLQEAIAQARLNHPNVVTIYYVGRHDNLPFLAMEHVGGTTLGDRLKLGPLPYAHVIQVAMQVADAMRHAQQFGIVHADIKPSNLLICGERQIKISDFGLSRMTAAERQAGKVAGTPAYLAPELLDGRGFSIQSDMYALGVTMFELAFGRVPFELRGTTVQERLQTHQTAVIEYPNPWPNEVPREFKTVLDKLLAKFPEDRYRDYETLQHDLQSLMPVSTTSAGLAPRAMAYAVDQLMLLISFAPFVLAMIALTRIEGEMYYAWLVPILGILSFAVPATYLTAIRAGWRSLGCYLFQLQTVDDHGLSLRSDLRFTREILRCMFAWLMPLVTYAGLFWQGVDRVVDTVVILFLALDIVCFFVTPNRTTLHDLICHARVVLDTKDRSKGRLSNF
jgi:eukaryotic-like serine/threonine-protein kinase